MIWLLSCVLLIGVSAAAVWKRRRSVGTAANLARDPEAPKIAEELSRPKYKVTSLQLASLDQDHDA